MLCRQLLSLISASLAVTASILSRTLAFHNLTVQKAYNIKVPVWTPMNTTSVFIPQWEVEATPGGEKLYLYGTVEEVFEQLREINPHFEADFNLNLNRTDPEEHSTRNLEKRADFDVDKIECNKLDTDGHVDAIQEGINYLRTVPGQPKNGPGPGNCGRVSCSWKSAIWWCNDNDEAKELKDFGEIADGAQAIWDKCTDVHWHFYLANGQAFHKDNWNVICEGSSC